MSISSTGQDFGHDYGISSAERKKRQQAEFDKFVGKKTKKEAFAFSEEDLEELDLFGEEIDAMTDEELIDMMEDLIIETAEDIDDLIEICEHLEGVEMLAEVSDKYYDSAVKSSKAAAKANRPFRVERMKSAAKQQVLNSRQVPLKQVQQLRRVLRQQVSLQQQMLVKQLVLSKQTASKQSVLNFPNLLEKKKEAPKSSSSDDDGTGGKLDALLAKTRGTSSAAVLPLVVAGKEMQVLKQERVSSPKKKKVLVCLEKQQVQLVEV